MATTPNALSKTDAKYDILKFLLSLLVMAVHSALYPMVLYPWLRIAVPLFFMTSSFFVFQKMREASESEQKAILKKFVIRNLQLYACWFVILLPMTVYLRKDAYFANGFLENVLTILKSIFFGSTFVASWFIPATILAVLIIYGLSRWVKKDGIVLIFSVLAFCIVTLDSSYASVIADTVILTVIDTYVDIFGAFVCSFPAAIFWVFMGKLFAEQKLKMKSFGLWIGLTVCSCIALFAEWKFVISLDGAYSNDSYFMLAPLCVLLFLGIQKIKPVCWQPAVYFRRASTIIYVVHGSALPIVSKAASLILHVKSPVLSFVLTLLFCMIVYLLIELAIGKCRTHRVNKVLRMLY